MRFGGKAVFCCFVIACAHPQQCADSQMRLPCVARRTACKTHQAKTTSKKYKKCPTANKALVTLYALVFMEPRPHLQDQTEQAEAPNNTNAPNKKSVIFIVQHWGQGQWWTIKTLYFVFGKTASPHAPASGEVNPGKCFKDPWEERGTPASTDIYFSTGWISNNDSPCWATRCTSKGILSFAKMDFK